MNLPKSTEAHPQFSLKCQSSPALLRGKMIDISGYVHTTQEKFEKRVFTLKTHQLFYVHTTRWKIENATITGQNSVREIT